MKTQLTSTSLLGIKMTPGRQQSNRFVTYCLQFTPTEFLGTEMAHDGATVILLLLGRKMGFRQMMEDRFPKVLAIGRCPHGVPLSNEPQCSTNTAT